MLNPDPKSGVLSSHISRLNPRPLKKSSLPLPLQRRRRPPEMVRQRPLAPDGDPHSSPPLSHLTSSNSSHCPLLCQSPLLALPGPQSPSGSCRSRSRRLVFHLPCCCCSSSSSSRSPLQLCNEAIFRSARASWSRRSISTHGGVGWGGARGGTGRGGKENVGFRPEGLAGRGKVGRVFGGGKGWRGRLGGGNKGGGDG